METFKDYSQHVSACLGITCHSAEYNENC